MTYMGQSVRFATRFGVGLAALALLAACSSDAHKAADGTPTSSASAGADTTSATPTTSAAVASVTSATSGPGDPSTGAGGCTNGEISVSSAPDKALSGAGASGAFLIFTNTSSVPCALTGFPGTDALDASGKVLAHAQRVGSSTGARITVPVGGTVSAVLRGSSDGSAACSAASILVTPPNLTTSTSLPAGSGTTWAACGLTISPIASGSTGPAS